MEPDTKDWTWVLEERCGACGFDSAAVAVEELPDRVRANVAGWADALSGADAAVRPAANIWSRLEYACHVRDVHLLFAERVRLMLDSEDPAFANWDQDATAVEQDYGAQDPGVVAVELAAAGAAMADLLAGVQGDQWQRSGRRSNGSVFTVASLAVYYLHDVVHHLDDIGR